MSSGIVRLRKHINKQTIEAFKSDGFTLFYGDTSTFRICHRQAPRPYPQYDEWRYSYFSTSYGDSKVLAVPGRIGGDFSHDKTITFRVSAKEWDCLIRDLGLEVQTQFPLKMVSEDNGDDT